MNEDESSDIIDNEVNESTKQVEQTEPTTKQDYETTSIAENDGNTTGIILGCLLSLSFGLAFVVAYYLTKKKRGMTSKSSVEAPDGRTSYRC